MKHEVTVQLHGGKSIHFETGKLAKQAHGSCIVRIGDNVVLATACANADPREGIDFFPLTVDYREYTYAAGRIPGGFIKREGRPSEREILTSRQIDRPIRPLFPEGFRCETQVIAMVLSADTTNDPDVAGINGASVALSVSDIPFHGPIGAVRVGQVNGEFVINPTYDEQREGKLNLMVVGTMDGIVMIESGAKEVSEETRGRGHRVRAPGDQEDLRRHQRAGTEGWQGEAHGRAGGRRTRRTSSELRSKFGARLTDAVNTEKYHKSESYALIKALKTEVKETVPEEDEAGRKKAGKYFDLLREADIPRAGDQGEAASGWAQVRPDPRYLDRSRRAAAHSRVVDLYPRRNPGAGYHHAGHGRRHAAARGLRRRSQEALHAALQLPAVLGR